MKKKNLLTTPQMQSRNEELSEILAIAKLNNITFPLKIAVLSRSLRSLAKSGESPLLYIVKKTSPMKNAEELRLWLDQNREKKHILLTPESPGTKARREAAKKTNEFLKANKPEHYTKASHSRWDN